MRWRQERQAWAKAALEVVLGTALAGLTACGGASDADGPPAHPAEHATPHEAASGAPERLATARSVDQQSDNLERIDPTRDGWDTEALAAAAKKILGHIGHRLEESRPLEEAELAGEVAPDFRGTRLVPAEPELAFQDGALTVRRAGAGTAGLGEMSQEGVRGLAQALEELRAGLHGASDTHVKIKVVRVEDDAASVVTTIAYQDQALHADRAVQRSADWRAEWERADDHLLLAGLALESFEEVVARTDGAKLFSECTASVLGDEPAWRDQLRFGSSYWAGRLEGTYSRTLLESHLGIAVADVDGDGLDDVYVCQPGGLPNRLLIQNPDGTVRDAAAEAGVDVLDSSFGVLLVDLDGDADPDLALYTGRRLWVFENDGKGHFTSRFRHVGNFGYSLTAADYDLDGDLDLYRCAYRSASGPAMFNQPVPLFDARNGGENVLLRNDGGFAFADVTAEVGLDHNNDRWSYAAAWEDFDNDGDQDLYVASDFGENNLYRNDGGRFVDVAPELGAVDANFGMSVTWGDVDHDGWMDVYVSNMFSAAGNRVVTQEAFKPGLSDESRATFLRLARGNTLLVNRPAEGNGGDGVERRFVDASDEANTTMGRWSWGSLFSDLNNDGWDDLLVSNGYLTQDTDQDL